MKSRSAWILFATVGAAVSGRLRCPDVHGGHCLWRLATPAALFTAVTACLLMMSGGAAAQTDDATADIYGAQCAVCHGPNGEGGAGPSLATSTMSLDEVAARIADGAPGMPGFADSLDGDALDDLSAFVAAFQTAASSPTTSAPPTSGSGIFAAECAGCHGASGEGLVAKPLQSTPYTTEDIAAIIGSGVKNMPSFSDRFTTEEIAGVAAFVFDLEPGTAPLVAPPGDTGEEVAPGSTAGSGTQASAGVELYIATCSGCHGADGSGNPGVFPPLVDNPNALDSAYVTDVIGDGLSGPITVNGVDYDAAMPAFGQLSDAEVADIVAFLGTNFQGPGTESPTTSGPAGSITPPAGGDADRGEDLFVGATDLANGGPACAACHKAGGRGNLGGSSLGPDLTGAVELYGGTDGLMAVIATPAFPVMNEVYADMPLTEQETADLAAFLVRASGEEDKDSGDALLIIGSVGAAALFGAMVIFRPFSGAGYSRRLRRNS